MVYPQIDHNRQTRKSGDQANDERPGKRQASAPQQIAPGICDFTDQS